MGWERARSTIGLVAVAVVLTVALGSCAQDDTATGEARDAYAALTAEPLWDAHPPGYELDYEQDLGCQLKPHSTEFRDVSSPSRMYVARSKVGWATPIAWYSAEARRDGWRVGKPDPWDDGYGDPIDHIVLKVRKAVDGQRFVITIGVTDSGSEALLELDATVEGVHICPPGTRT